MSDTSEVTSAPPVKLSKEERSQIAKKAAVRRWAKAKKVKLAASPVKAVKAPKSKKSSSPREFSSALKMAEKRLSKAIQERAEAGARYAVLNAEIPSLQRIIAALQHPAGYLPGYESSNIVPNFTLEQIVGDQPLGYQNPPPPQQVPARAAPLSFLPPDVHPANVQSRAMGGAIGIEIPVDDNENAFLEGSGVAGGDWH
jgi:hypothetical protein